MTLRRQETERRKEEKKREEKKKRSLSLLGLKVDDAGAKGKGCDYRQRDQATTPQLPTHTLTHTNRQTDGQTNGQTD